MRNYKKYRKPEKFSYRKGVLYEVERTVAGDDIIVKKNKPKRRIAERIFLSIGGFLDMIGGRIAGLFAARRRHGVKTYGNKSIRKTRSASAADKKLYLVSTVIAFGIVVLTALVTTIALAGNTVVINDEGRISYATAKRGQTVTQLLEANNISVSSADTVEVSDDQKLTDGMQIIIHRAMPIKLYADGEERTVNILAGTVEDVIREAGIELGEYDEVYPELSANITVGTTVSVIRVEVKEITETSAIEYKEIRKQSDKYAKGEEVLAQEGKNGTLKKVINVVYKDGVEFKREVVSSTVVKKAQDEIVYIGTHVAPMAPQKPEAGGGDDNDKQESSGGADYGQSIPAVDGLLTKLPTLSQLHSGTLAQHKSVAAPSPELIDEVIMCETTAYTWTGNKTATGVYPRIGTLAVDPKLIPYGTLVYIPGYGYGRAEDTGGFKSSAKGYWIDLYMDSYNECINWGRRNIKVYILKG